MQQIVTNKSQPHESGGFSMRVGSTVYRVSVHFSQTSKETANDKIIRLVRNEAGKVVKQ